MSKPTPEPRAERGHDSDSAGSSAERDLGARLRSGDRDAFERAYAEHFAPIRNLIAAMIGDWHEAEDLAQEVFAKVWASPESYDPGRGPLGGWAATVARNRSIDHFRRSSLVQPERPERIVALVKSRAPASDDTPEWFQHADFPAHFRRLRPTQQIVVFLRCWCALSHEEIAAEIGAEPGAVRQIHHRALESLRRRLEPLRDRETRRTSNPMVMLARPSRVVTARRLSLAYGI